VRNDTGPPTACSDRVAFICHCVRLTPCLALLLLAAGCHAEPPKTRTVEGGAVPVAGDPNRKALTDAIDRSARYLAGACGPDGKFTYRINLDPDIAVDPQYNVLRHAGAVYALAQYNRTCRDDVAKDAMLRAAQFLWDECTAPVAGNPNVLAMWSEPELVSNDRRQAKLGGTGLGLAALLAVQEVEPGFKSIDELRQLGRFLIFMQKSDGSFYSKYFLDTGRSDLWQSMYYPGEAALGLIMLYEWDRSEQWLRAVNKALDNLARQGAGQRPTVPDQWYLLAVRRWQAQAGAVDASLKERVMEHARRLCRDMVQEQQQQQLDDAKIAGCFTPEGRTCPSATRLEGLLAALQFLPPGDSQLIAEVREATHMGMQFLLDSQVVEGPHAGALPRFRVGVDLSGVSASEQRRAKEVRIDYVQHALSAMIAYQQIFH
jgi:hypothetical protein